MSDDEAARLIAENQRLIEEREHYRELYLQTLEHCRKLERGIIGPKSERLGDNDAQLTMAVFGDDAR